VRVGAGSEKTWRNDGTVTSGTQPRAAVGGGMELDIVHRRGGKDIQGIRAGCDGSKRRQRVSTGV